MLRGAAALLLLASRALAQDMDPAGYSALRTFNDVPADVFADSERAEAAAGAAKANAGEWWYDTVEETDLARPIEPKPVQLEPLARQQLAGPLDILDLVEPPAARVVDVRRRLSEQLQASPGVEAEEDSVPPQGFTAPKLLGAHVSRQRVEPTPEAACSDYLRRWRRSLTTRTLPMASCIATSQTTALPLDECAGPAIPLQTVHSLTFDAPTNRADMFGVEPCSAVLDAQSLAMLQGEDEDEPECVWNSESELQAPVPPSC